MNTAVTVALIAAVGAFAGALGSTLASWRSTKSADWSGYTGRMQARLTAVERRLDEAEQRGRECDQRADRAERLQVVAVSYLREILGWVQHCFPGQTPPRAPSELDGLL